MSPTLQRHYDLPDDELVPATAAPRTLIVGLSAKRPAAGLSLPVEVEHLRAPDLATIARPGWLAPDHHALAEHERHLATIADAERALSELEAELQRVRRARMTAQLDGAKRPPVDEAKIRREREEAVVVARAALVKWADATLGEIRTQAPERLAALQADVSARAERIAELRAELAALDAVQHEADSECRWLRSQTHVVRLGGRPDPGLGGWPPYVPLPPDPTREAVAERLRTIAGRPSEPVAL